MSPNTGSSTAQDQSMNPKKLGKIDDFQIEESERPTPPPPPPPKPAAVAKPDPDTAAKPDVVKPEAVKAEP